MKWSKFLSFCAGIAFLSSGLGSGYYYFVALPEYNQQKLELDKKIEERIENNKYHPMKEVIFACEW